MDLELENKVYIVSGGAKGIGGAVSKELAKEGARVVNAGRSAEAGDQMKQEIEEHGGEALNVVAELSEKGACKAIIEKSLEAYGQIDGIVNNAGVNDGVSVEKGTPEKFIESVRTNLLHYYELVHYALPSLKETKGSVINISSKTAITGQGGTSGYAASKGAQLALTREWAVELAPFGIRVNAVIPSEVLTPQYERWINSFDDAKHSLSLITSKIPFEKRMTTSEEIASMTVFLLSNKSSHTTGQWIVVDGGYIHLDRAIS